MWGRKTFFSTFVIVIGLLEGELTVCPPNKNNLNLEKNKKNLVKPAHEATKNMQVIGTRLCAYKTEIVFANPALSGLTI